MKLRVLPEARRQARRAERWWRENRPAAAALFVDELETGLEQVARLPDSGTPYRHRERGDVRRLLLPRTRHHIYYVHDAEREEVRVLAVWSAVRGRTPALDSP